MSDLREKFYKDPDWKTVESQILSYIEPLKDMGTLDLTQPAEHVKAEIVGRILAYNSLSKFLEESGMVKQKLTKYENPFR